MALNIEHADTVLATPEQVWRVFEQIERWPRWDPSAIRHVRWVSGQPWTKGARFEIAVAKPMPFTLTPELVQVDPPVFVHVRGKGSGVTGEQFFIFKWDQQSQRTEMRTLQEFSGVPVQMFGERARGIILDGVRHMFAQIKSEAEASASQPPEPFPS